VLIVAAEFPPLGGGGVLRATKLAKYLARRGWTVTVACSDDPMGDAVDESLLAELPPAVSVIRVGSRVGTVAKRAAAAAKTRLGRRNPIFNVLFRLRAAGRAVVSIPDRWISWALQVGRMTASSLGEPQVAVSTGPPHSGHIAAALLHRRLNIPYIVDYRDEWVLNPFYATRLPWRRVIERRLERWCLAGASRVVFVSQASVDRYAARHPDLASRFMTISNGFDPEDLPVATARTRAEGPPVIGYAGSINNRRDAQTFFRAFGQVVRDSGMSSPPRLLLVGTISEDQEAIATAEIPADHLDIRPFAPHRRALELMSECDALLVLTNEAEAGPAALTGKIYEYLALRRPILMVAPAGPGTALIEEANAGVTADPGDESAIDRAIRAVLVLAGGESFSGASHEVLARFDRARQAETWSEVLADVLRS
jgi:glycosyltransferase involved in cell wall biosynthesis